MLKRIARFSNREMTNYVLSRKRQEEIITLVVIVGTIEGKPTAISISFFFFLRRLKIYFLKKAITNFFFILKIYFFIKR